jgi:hypothetical protein
VDQQSFSAAGNGGGGRIASAKALGETANMAAMAMHRKTNRYVERFELARGFVTGR